MQDDRNDRQPLDLIYQQRKQVHDARVQYWRSGAHCDVPRDIHLDLAAVTVAYFDVLFEFREEGVLDESDWPDIGKLRSRINKTVEKETQSAGLSRGKTTKEVPALLEVPIEEILRMTKQLDDVASKLGFGAQAVQAVPEDEADADDLNELLRNRGHDEVADRLPGGAD